jgi:hypothetical protein
MTTQDRPNQARPRRLRPPERDLQSQFEPGYQATESLAAVYARLVPLRRRALAEPRLPRLPAAPVPPDAGESQQRPHEAGLERGYAQRHKRSLRCS